MGIEGTGRVVDGNGKNAKKFVGKRVCFFQAESGTWGEFAIAEVGNLFEIDEDVSLTSAASGVVNPLTVVGLIHTF